MNSLYAARGWNGVSRHTLCERQFSSLDQIASRSYMRLLLCFPLKDADQKRLLSQTIKQAVQDTLAHYPYLAGQIVIKNENFTILFRRRDRFQREIVQCKDIPGDIFAYTYQDLAKEGMPMNRLSEDIFSPLDATPDLSKPFPPLAIQINYIQGGMILGICCHHLVTDGVGFVCFLSRLAENIRNPTVRNPNLEIFDLVDDAEIRRDLSTGLSPNQSMIVCREFSVTLDPFLLSHPELLEGVKNQASTQYVQALKVKVARVIFVIPLSRLRALKYEAKHYIPANTAFVSTSDILHALIWTCVTRARLPSRTLLNTGENQTALVRLGRPVSIRTKLASAEVLSQNMANATLLTTTSLYLAELLPLVDPRDPKASMLAIAADTTGSVKRLARVAVALRGSVQGINDRYIRNRISLINSLGTLKALRPDLNWKSPAGRDLLISSWDDAVQAAIAAAPQNLANVGESDATALKSLDEWNWGLPGIEADGGRVGFVRRPVSDDEGTVFILPRRRHPKPFATGSVKETPSTSRNEGKRGLDQYSRCSPQASSGAVESNDRLSFRQKQDSPLQSEPAAKRTKTTRWDTPPRQPLSKSARSALFSTYEETPKIRKESSGSSDSAKRGHSASFNSDQSSSPLYHTPASSFNNSETSSSPPHGTPLTPPSPAHRTNMNSTKPPTKKASHASKRNAPSMAGERETEEVVEVLVQMETKLMQNLQYDPEWMRFVTKVIA